MFRAIVIRWKRPRLLVVQWLDRLRLRVEEWERAAVRVGTGNGCRVGGGRAEAWGGALALEGHSGAWRRYRDSAVLSAYR